MAEKKRVLCKFDLLYLKKEVSSFEKRGFSGGGKMICMLNGILHTCLAII